MAGSMNRKTESGILTVQVDGKTVCPAARFQQMVSGKYKLRILWGLKEGWRRYGEIKSGLLTGNVGTAEIAPRVLSRELKTLVAMGMVERKDHQVFPLKVEYRLTCKGRSFLPIIAVIHKWGLRHLV
jgi:DNA-binding HxlR family transcriptional regulator